MTENPISECGVWHHGGLDWKEVATQNGLAFGTQNGSNGYDDSYAILSGFGPDQQGSGTIHLQAGYVPPSSHEVEILLRVTDGPHEFNAYECNLAWGGSYAQIVLLQGVEGNYTVLPTSGSPMEPKDGDVFSCSIVGSLITATLNGNIIAQATDSTLTVGQPGMAFFTRPGATEDGYCYSDYSATDL